LFHEDPHPVRHETFPRRCAYYLLFRIGIKGTPSSLTLIYRRRTRRACRRSRLAHHRCRFDLRQPAAGEAGYHEATSPARIRAPRPRSSPADNTRQGPPSVARSATSARNIFHLGHRFRFTGDLLRCASQCLCWAPVVVVALARSRTRRRPRRRFECLGAGNNPFDTASQRSHRAPSAAIRIPTCSSTRRIRDTVRLATRSVDRCAHTGTLRRETNPSTRCRHIPGAYTCLSENLDSSDRYLPAEALKKMYRRCLTMSRRSIASSCAVRVVTACQVDCAGTRRDERAKLYAGLGVSGFATLIGRWQRVSKLIS